VKKLTIFVVSFFSFSPSSPPIDRLFKSTVIDKLETNRKKGETIMFFIKCLFVLFVVGILYSFQKNFRELYSVLETKNRFLRTAQAAIGSCIGLLVDGI
jgi:hypothetical protein